MVNKLPKVSIVILALNGIDYLKRCLTSIRSQKYSQNRIEIIVVDNGSRDNSVQIARSFGARVFIKPKTDLYQNWAFAMHKVTGSLTYLVDQDIELRGEHFLARMVKPLLEDNKITGSFTRAYPNSKMSWITRFLSYHPFQCDPLYEFLTPSVEKTIVGKGGSYKVCKFEISKIPAESRMMYRVSVLKKTPNWDMDRLFDHDTLIKTVKSGYNLFAYVPSAGIYHYHAPNLRDLLKKRVRNLRIHYFPYSKSLEYRWLDTIDKRNIFKMILWVIYANLLIPATIRGLWRFLKFRDPALLSEPIVTVAVTDTVLFNFLTNPVGRKIIGKFFQPLFNK